MSGQSFQEQFQAGCFFTAKLLQVEHQPVPALRQGFRDPVCQAFGVVSGQDTFETKPHLFLGVLQLNLN